MTDHKEMFTIEEIEKAEGILPVVESLSIVLTAEKITTYSALVDEFLQANSQASFEIRLMALTLLKTLSHLSGDQSKLFEQPKSLPLKEHRELYYAIPFLSEIAGGGNLLKWYQEETKYLLSLKHAKGDYQPLRLLIYFYESLLFRMVMEKQQRKSYFQIAEQVFKKIREHIQSLQSAYEKKEAQHPWVSLDRKSLLVFKQILRFWKMVVDTTTVRHGPHLPTQFRRPAHKLPFEWSELLRIKKVAKVSMINAIYLLNGLSSQCREIRTYSSFILHRVWKERPKFLESFKNTKVEAVFLKRLQVAYHLRESYPHLPEDLPADLQVEMFLVLIEQGMNTLAAQHHLGDQEVGDLQEAFSNFSEQVQAKDEIVIATLGGATDSSSAQAKPPQSEEVEDCWPAYETDFPAVTDDQELGMGVQTMPFIFPFTYEEDQEELPFEQIPNIKWDKMKWNGTNAHGISLQVAETSIFVDKLEILSSYRYDIYSLKEIGNIKPFQQYTCFLVKRETAEKTQYYIVKKGGKKTSQGKSTVSIALNLSEQYLEKIDEAFFFIFPPPYNQHILAIPR